MKQGIYLVVETPRAGRLGHRYIRSSNVFPTEQSIVDIFTKAGMNPVAANYISVSMSVTQTLPGSVRQGNERIVLIGVNTQKVNIVKIKAALQKLFVPLDQLIKGTDWEKESNKIICSNSILEGWISGEDFQDLPEYKPEDPKPPLLDLSEKIKKSLFIIILFLFVGGGVLLSQKVSSQRKKEDPSVDNKSTEQYMDRLMGEFKCKEEVDKFKKEMKSYIEATSPKYEESKLEEYAKSFYDQKDNVKPKSKNYITLFLNESGGEYKNYFKKCTNIENFNYFKLKKNVFECKNQFVKISNLYIENRRGLNNKIYSSNMKFETQNLLVEKFPPVTPLFNIQTKECLEDFLKWIKNNAKPFAPMGFLDLNKCENNFLEIITELHKNHEQIKNDINKEKKTYSNNTDNVNIINFYDNLLIFIDNLSKLDPSQKEYSTK